MQKKTSSTPKKKGQNSSPVVKASSAVPTGPLSSKRALDDMAFKIIIIGAGIAGLSLANMLKQAGIDFVVLEAYKDIERPAGGSYGIWPNAARILDQIECWENIQASCKPIEANHVRLPNGDPIKSSNISSLAAAKSETSIMTMLTFC